MAKKLIWMFSDNFIINGIRDSYILALIVAKFHLDALTANNSDPDIAAREVIFQGKYDTLKAANLSKGVDTGDRIEDTATLAEQFQTIMTIEMPLWQSMIIPIAPRRSAVYKGLFPNGVDDIEKGRIEDKIEAVEILAAATLAKGMPAVSGLITTRFNALTATRNSQLGLKSTIGGTIGDQKAAILDMCIAHFFDHGLVITKFTTNPKKIASFTDYVSMQNHVHSTTYEGTVNGEKTKTSLKHNFTPTSTMEVLSTVDMQIWVIDSAKNPVKPVGVFIPANTPTIVRFPAAGNPANRIVQVKNLTTLKGKYQIIV